MKPTKLRMKRLLCVLCLWHKCFKLINVAILYASKFIWLSMISTVSWRIISVRYFEVKCCLISFMNTIINISTMEHGNVWCCIRFRPINRHNILISVLPLTKLRRFSFFLESFVGGFLSSDDVCNGCCGFWLSFFKWTSLSSMKSCLSLVSYLKGGDLLFCKKVS